LNKKRAAVMGKKLDNDTEISLPVANCPPFAKTQTIVENQNGVARQLGTEQRQDGITGSRLYIIGWTIND
jgi:hypothetical protein